MPRHARRFVKQGEPLPDTDVHSESFRQTRAARRGALAEDYVELIADLIDNGNEARQVDIAARLGVSQPTVAKMLTRLAADGLVSRKLYRGVFLTEAGRRIARESRTRHQTVEALLRSLGVSAETARIDAEGIEHHVSAETLDAIRRFLLKKKILVLPTAPATATEAVLEFVHNTTLRHYDRDAQQNWACMRAPATDTGPNQQSRNAIGPSPKVKGNQASSNLPTEAIHARRFGKVRTARSSALIEDYVELIDDLLSATGNARPMDLARRLGVSHVAAIKTIWRLKREGLATGRPYRGIFLTTQGQKLAARVRARHRLVVDVLLALGAPAEAAEVDAEGIKHYVSDTTLRAFADFIG